MMAAFLLPTNSDLIKLNQRSFDGNVNAAVSPVGRLSFGVTPMPLSSLRVAPVFGPSSVEDLPLPTPIILLAAIALAVLAQSWINSLIGGEQGLGAFLSDGTGYNKSGFKPRKKFVMDGRSNPGSDPSKPLGAGDPMPWLKLPEFDYVDVAGQPKKPRQPKIIANSSGESGKDETEVVARLEFLFAQMKKEVGNDNLIEAKRFELELEKIMEKEGFGFSSKQNEP